MSWLLAATVSLALAGEGEAPPPQAPEQGAPQARVLLGGAWTPTGTGALALQSTGSLSGTLAGELDGLLVPALRAYGGVRRGRTSWLGEASWAQVDVTRRLVSGDSSTRSVGALRLGGRWRRDLWPRPPGGSEVRMSAHAGAHGNVPLVSLRDTAWTEAEALDAENTVADLRRRVGGGGLDFGVGARAPVLHDDAGAPALTLGLRAGMMIHARAGATTEDGSAVFVALPDVALTLEWEAR
jgi:hypothetical protein